MKWCKLTRFFGISLLVGCINSEEEVAGWVKEAPPADGTDLEDSRAVRIQAQTFDMGCTEGQSNCESNERPVMPVTLSYDYFIDKFELSQTDFEDLMGYNPSLNTACGGDCPVERVSWHEAAAYADALSLAEGLEACHGCSGSGIDSLCETPVRPKDCMGYRLPTEAEWEAAARCGSDTLYAGSSSADSVAWTRENSGVDSHPVGQLTPNACGTFDMSGNVFEWAWDRYASNYYVADGRLDPSGPESGPDRSIRGGFFGFQENFSRVSVRERSAPADTFKGIGFRLARTAP